MALPETLSAIRELIQGSSSLEWQADDRLALTVIDGSIPFSLISRLESGEVYAEFESPEIQQQINSNQTGFVPSNSRVTLRVPRAHGRLIVTSGLARLMAIPGYLTREPAGYVFCGHGISWFSHLQGEALTSASATVQHYHEAIRLWVILEARADHVGDDDQLLYFGVSRRTEILPQFAIDDLPTEIASGEVAAFVENADGHETRIEIFKSVLSEFLRDQSSQNAFRWLLRGSQLFARRLKEGLAIYLAEHSPEKLAEEAKVAAMEFSEKLEKIIAALESKSLAIPAALLLAATQAKQGVGFSVLNTLIFISSATFGLTMTLVHWSQLALLRVLGETISVKRRELENKGLAVDNPLLSESFEGLRKRRAAAVCGSWAMFVFSLIPLIAVAFVIREVPSPSVASNKSADVDASVPSVSSPFDLRPVNLLTNDAAVHAPADGHPPHDAHGTDATQRSQH